MVQSNRKLLMLSAALMLVLAVFAFLPRAALKASAQMDLDLWIGEENFFVSDGHIFSPDNHAEYDPETKTLTITGDLQGGLKSEIDGLTVKVAKNSFVPSISFSGNTTITGSGKLTVNNTEKYVGLYVRNKSTLKIIDANLDISGINYGITGDSEEWLYIRNSVVKAKGKLGGIRDFYSLEDDDADNGIILEDAKLDSINIDDRWYECIIHEGNVWYGYWEDTGDNYEPLWDFYKIDFAQEVSIIPYYHILVSNEMVDYNNKDDILGDGKMSYDPKKNTLYLKGGVHDFDVRYEDWIDSSEVDLMSPGGTRYIPGIRSYCPGLIINVTKNTEIYGYIDLANDGTITGSGKLTVRSSGYENYGIKFNFESYIENANIEVDSSADYALYGGEYGSTVDLTIKNSTVKATSKKSAFYGFSSYLAGDCCLGLVNCDIASPAGAENAYGKTQIIDANGKAAKSVTIKPKPKSISLKYSSYTYTGKAITLDSYMTVKDANGKVLVKDTDYTVSYKNNTKVGYNTATVTVTGKGKYTGSVSKKFTIKPKKNSITSIVSSKGGIIVKWNEDTSAVGYQVIYCKNSAFDTSDPTYHSTTVDRAKSSNCYVNLSSIPKAGEKWYVKVRSFITSNGKVSGTRYGNYSDAKSVTVTNNIAIDKVNLEYASYTYTGSAIKPKITSVIDVHGNKVPASSYGVMYANNTKVGKATIVVTGKGSYNGSNVSRTFVIKPKPGTLTLTAGKASFKAAWTKDTSASGYEVVYSKDKNFKSNVFTYSTSDNTKTSENFSSKPKSGETWYVKYRAYITVDGVKYGNYSAVKSVKTK